METYSLYDLDTMVVTNTISTDDDINNIINYATSVNKGVYQGISELGSIVSEDGLSIIGKATTMSDIYEDLNSGGLNLTSLINNLPEVKNNNITANDWAKQHYVLIRSKLYPAIEDLADALVKINSSDEQLNQTGSIELQSYVAKCLDVKNRIPKL